MTKILKDYDMKSPVTGNNISEPIKFNLMFATSIGPTGHIKGFVHVVYHSLFCYILKVSLEGMSWS